MAVALVVMTLLPWPASATTCLQACRDEWVECKASDCPPGTEDMYGCQEGCMETRGWCINNCGLEFEDMKRK